MKTLLSGILIACALLWSVAFADTNKEPAKKASAAELNKAYAEYQKLAAEEKWADSLPHIKRAYELGVELLGEKRETVVLAFDYGTNLKKLRDYRGAVAILESALALGEKVYGKDSVELIPILTDLGLIVYNTPKMDDYKMYYDRALKISEQAHGAGSLELAKLQLQLADDIMMRADGKRGAREHAASAYEILQKRLGDKHPMTGYAALLMGKYALMVGSHRRAKDWLTKTLNTFDTPDAPDSQIEMITHGFLVEVNERLGDSEEATRHCLAIGRMTPAKDTQNYFPVFKPVPEYPKEAAEKKQEGEVILEFTVSASGFVVEPKVIHSTNPMFNESALQSVKKYRYAPYFVGGKPAPVSGVQNKIIYQLHPESKNKDADES